jgi:pimeloyl-ACP methyl ester carboxylesterase
MLEIFNRRAIGSRGRFHKAAISSLLCALLGLAASPGARADDASGRIIGLPNVNLWVSDSGGAGDPVVLLHPNTGTSELWQKSVPALVRAGYRVIALDKPGWGRSVVRGGQKPISLAEDLDALIDTLKLAKVHLIGAGNGGAIAVDYAAWRPARVKSVVIAASGVGLQDDAEGDAFRQRAAIPEFEHLPAEIREMSPSYRGMNPAGVARWKEIEEHARQKGALDPPMRTPNTVEKIASLTMPILVIAGDADLTTPSGAIHLWAKHLTKPYDWVLIPEAGHALAWEQPEAFNRAVIAFLHKH